MTSDTEFFITLEATRDDPNPPPITLEGGREFWELDDGDVAPVITLEGGREDPLAMKTFNLFSILALIRRQD